MERQWRERARGYLFASSQSDRLFARFSDDPSDEAVLAHERAARRAIPEDGPLRAPRVLAWGARWMLEEAIEEDEPDRAAVVAAAGRRIPEVDVPEAPPGGGRRSAWAHVRRRARLLRSPLPIRDVLRAKAVERALDLPRVPSHGDFHPGNVLVRGGVAWVVDWELSGLRPAGSDLLRYWAATPRKEEREVLLEAALDLVGAGRRDALLRLRYAVAVTTAAQQLAAPDDFNVDQDAGARLLRELPSLRAEAGL